MLIELVRNNQHNIRTHKSKPRTVVKKLAAWYSKVSASYWYDEMKTQATSRPKKTDTASSDHGEIEGRAVQASQSSEAGIAGGANLAMYRPISGSGRGRPRARAHTMSVRT